MIRPGRERARRDRNYLRDWEIWHAKFQKHVAMHKVFGVRYGKKQLLDKGGKP